MIVNRQRQGNRRSEVCGARFDSLLTRFIVFVFERACYREAL